LLAAAGLVVAGGVGTRLLASQNSAAAAWQPAGLSVADAIDSTNAEQVGTLAPAVAGANTFVLQTEPAQTHGQPQPTADVTAVAVHATCACGAARDLVLVPNKSGTAWVAPADLPAAGRWTFEVRLDRPRHEAEKLSLVETVVSADAGKQEVIGVPADLSGPAGRKCRDQVLGAQVALTDVNATGEPNRTRTRLDVVDLGGGVDAAMAQLDRLGARAIALPCGEESAVAAIVSAAQRAGLPVVLGAPPAPTTGAGVWSAVPDWGREGSAIGVQTKAQAAGRVEVVSGPGTVDAAELAGLRQQLAGSGVNVRYDSLPGDVAAWVRGLPDYNLVVMLLGPGEAQPLLHAMSTVATGAGRPGLPGRGVLASSQLFDTDVIDSAWPITRIGVIEFAGDVNPFDPVVQYYLQREQVLVFGLRPTIEGIHGYNAALALAEAVRVSGGRPSAQQLSQVLGTRLTGFTIGSYGLNWTPAGGSSDRLAFFRTTYLNPMAMPVEAPGGAADAAHMGALLGDGGFEQVAAFRTLT
jgi:hypothetical protein